MKTRIFCLLLAAMMTLTLIASCSGGEKKTDAQTTAAGNTPVATETEPPETEPSIYDDVPTGDFGGYTFRIMNATLSWAQEQLEAEELNGNVLNDAVFNRNRQLEKDVNIVLKVEEASDTTAANNFRNTITAGDDAWDASFQMVYRLASYGADNLFYDLYKVEKLNLDKPWYDTRSREFFELNGHLFWSFCSAQFEYFEGLWSTYFNKRLVKDYKIESPYDLVKSGKWTIDKFSEIIKDTSKDLNADGVLDGKDQHGYVTHKGAAFAWLHGSDARAVDIDKDALHVPTPLSDRQVNVIQKIQGLLGTNKDVWLDPAAQPSDYFRAGLGVFCSEVLGRAQDLREMDDDFGIIPYPKYDEKQENYICYTSPSSSALFIPVTVKDIDRTAVVIENMNALSYETVVPAYYDVVLTGKTLRDNDSEAMLDIMFASVECELAYVYQWGGFQNTYLNLLISDSPAASTIESAKPAVESAIKTFKEKLDKIG